MRDYSPWVGSHGARASWGPEFLQIGYRRPTLWAHHHAAGERERVATGIQRRNDSDVKEDIGVESKIFVHVGRGVNWKAGERHGLIGKCSDTRQTIATTLALVTR
jgi:hypothetical protein